jgi:diaminohydroxyphosphoribosylaminopyrimidine deaminase / 5-amino-6-(5-phosphoribosylamino)uracil reductase
MNSSPSTLSAGSASSSGLKPWDNVLMANTIALGARNLGRAWPNPSVGAILVRETSDGPVILSRGITSAGGRPHAERVAFAAAGEAARGSTLYVSLEPCSHYGRTPPCVDAIIEAGVTRVVAALEDPDPRVAGSGYARLREAGIMLETSVMAAEAYRGHRGHITRVTKARPAVTIKIAMTADGYAAGPSGAPRLKITGPAMDAQMHLMRAHFDAIMVGVGTVIADDPRLDVRLPGLADRSPLRIVIDSNLKLAGHPLRMLETVKVTPVWIIAGEQADPDAERKLVEAGAQVLRVAVSANGKVDLGAALAALATHGLTHVLCEGGPALAEALAQHDLVDEVMRITGISALIDGQQGYPAFGPALGAYLAGDWICYERAKYGSDMLERFERRA